MLTLKIEREARASQKVASLPWRRPWWPRFQREGKKEIRPHQGAIEAINTSWWWREVRRSYGRDGGGVGATQCTRDDGGTARRCGSSAAALWVKKEAGKCEMRALGVAGGCWRVEGARLPALAALGRAPATRGRRHGHAACRLCRWSATERLRFSSSVTKCQV